MTTSTSASHGRTDRQPALEDGSLHDLYVDCLGVIGSLGPIEHAPHLVAVNPDTGVPFAVPDNARELISGLSSYGA